MTNAFPAIHVKQEQPLRSERGCYSLESVVEFVVFEKVIQAVVCGDDTRSFVGQLKCPHVGSCEADVETETLSTFFRVSQHVFGKVESDHLVAVFGQLCRDHAGAASEIDNLGTYRESILLQIFQQMSGERETKLLRPESVVDFSEIAISIYTNDFVVS